MTQLQEAARKALYALDASIDGDLPYYDDQLTAIEALRTALAQQGEQAKPVAYITDTHQGPMVWTPEMYGEACMYCDDGEFPVPLYTAAPAPQTQEPVLGTKTWFDGEKLITQNLTASDIYAEPAPVDREMCMARENAVLRVALREVQDASNWAYGAIADKLGEAK